MQRCSADKFSKAIENSGEIEREGVFIDEAGAQYTFSDAIKKLGLEPEDSDDYDEDKAFWDDINEKLIFVPDDISSAVMYDYYGIWY